MTTSLLPLPHEIRSGFLISPTNKYVRVPLKIYLSPKAKLSDSVNRGLETGHRCLKLLMPVALPANGGAHCPPRV